MDTATKIRRMARRLAWKLSKDDPQALAEDLEMAGWIGYLEDHRGDEGLRLMRARTEMIDAWVQWRFGVRRRSRKQQHDRECPMQIPENWDQPDDSPGPAAMVEAKDLVEKLEVRLDESRLSHTRDILRNMLLDETPWMAGDGVGISQKQVFRRKHLIQREMKNLIGGNDERIGISSSVVICDSGDGLRSQLG